MTTRMFCCAVVVAAASLMTSMASANLLLNGNFEDPAPPPEGHAAVDWPRFSFTSTSVLDTAMPHTGTNAIKEGIATPTTGSTGIFQRLQGIVPGEEYTLSVWAKAGALPITSDDANNGGAVMRIVFETLDAGFPDTGLVEKALGPLGGTPGVPVTGDGLLTTEYQQFTLAGTAPAGTEQILVQLYSRHSDQYIYFDDAELLGLQVPEPTSVGLALLGGLGVLGLRRRDKCTS